VLRQETKNSLTTLGILTSVLLGPKLNGQSEMNSRLRRSFTTILSFSHVPTLERNSRRAARLRFGAVVLLLLGLPFALVAADELDTNAPAASSSDTNRQETLRAYLQLQEQLQLTQLAIEQNRREAREGLAQSSEVLVGRLQTIEKALETQRSRELQEMQSANRAMLLVAGTFAGVGFLAMFLMSFFQWRTVSRLAEISAGLPASLALGQGRGSDASVINVGPAEQSSARLLGAMERLEKRIFELEHTTQPAADDSPSPANGHGIVSIVREEAAAENQIEDSGLAGNGDHERVSTLLGKGQSMLSLDNAQAAVACFDEALSLEPDNAEVWVRKGTALERLQQLDQAVECYDRAISIDGSMTIAYLHKGGLFNRMERFNDALECYEKALRTQEKRHA
jgi:tetratricopeptide (TPR) repeat protein